MKYDPAKLNREFSATVQSAAESKLGRSLTLDEEYRIWNLGSFIQLEAVDRNIAYANSGLEVAQILAGLPKDEPLPEEFTQREA